MLKFLNANDFIKKNSIIFYKIVWDQVLLILVFSILTLITYDEYNFPKTDSIEEKIVNSIYFNSATQFTVGYGDYTPTSNLTKIINVLHHLMSYFIMATEISFIFRS